MPNNRPLGASDPLHQFSLEAVSENPRALATLGLLLQFFSHRVLVAKATSLLVERGFGLLHHRILYFSHFAYGITVGEIIALLRVTHQNLIRGLRRLLDEGYVVAKTSEEDRRVKKLYTTAKGARLLAEINGPQLDRILQAYSGCSERDMMGYFRVLNQMVENLDREAITRMVHTRQPSEGPPPLPGSGKPATPAATRRKARATSKAARTSV